NFTDVKPLSWVYFAATLDAAIWGAELAAGTERGRIYVVEPTGPIMDDPNVTDKKFPGNPTLSYRSRDPLRVIAEVTQWQGHAPERLQQMKDNVARLRTKCADIIDQFGEDPAATPTPKRPLDDGRRCCSAFLRPIIPERGVALVELGFDAAAIATEA